MDRIFDQNYIRRICAELKSALNECDDYLEQLKKTAARADSAYGIVPAEAKNNALPGAANTLRGAVNQLDVDMVIRKLENCKARATELIPAADTQYAAETRELIKVFEQIKEALAQMTDFMVNTSFVADPADFAADLEVAQKKWKTVLRDADELLEAVRANIKGAEEISSVFSQDPVNLSTGNFIYDQTDLAIAGNTPFTFRRFYNSINQHTGVLGADWNHNYEVYIETQGTERILMLEEGKEERFLLTGKGTYESLYQSNGWLEKWEDGYHYRTREQKHYYFDQDGRLRRITEADGHSLLFYYVEQGGRFCLGEIKKASGETMTLSYDEAGYLSAVSDHTGRTVSYQVVDGHLNQVRTPLGHIYQYTYSQAGQLHSIENPRGITVVENEFDDQRRTVRQSFPDGGSMAYEYQDDENKVILTERNGSKVTYVHDKNYRDVKHIYPDGEERFAYNQANQKTLIVDKLGRRTQYAYDPQGNLCRIINPLGQKIELLYDSANLPLSMRVNGEEKLRNQYDEHGNLVSSQDALGNQYQLVYQKAGQPHIILQPDGSQIRLTYDQRGNITTIKDAAGHESHYDYNDLNQVVKSIDGEGNVTRYHYDAEDNLTEVLDAKGQQRTYRYNANNKVLEITDFDGSSLQREYNVLGKIASMIDQAGRETRYSYDIMWNLAKVVEPNGAKTLYIYDEHNQLSRIKNANGDTVRYTYDIMGNRTGVEDEEGNKTFFAYDELDRLTAVTTPAGQLLAYEYDANGNVSKVTNVLDRSVTLYYDRQDNLIQEVGSEGEARYYSYTSLGDIAAITDEAGGITAYQYAPGGQLTGITHPDGTSEHYTYDKAGNVRSYTNPQGYTQHFAYDALNRVVAVTGDDGEARKYAYDAVGNLIGFTDEEGHSTVYKYSLTGQLIAVIDPVGNETAYSYDLCDRLIEIRQHAGTAQGQAVDPFAGLPGKVKYERDILGRVIKATNAAGEAEHYQYDRKGQLLEQIDRDGYLTRYTYNAAGDVSDIQYADGKAVKLSYNSLRQLEEIEDWLGLTRIENDAKGRATQVIYPDDQQVAYEYSSGGERKAIHYPDGRTVRYMYDQAGRLQTLQAPGQEIRYRYDPSGNLVEKVSDNGLKTAYQYNHKGQMTGLQHSKHEEILDSYQYTYNAIGYKTGMQKHRKGMPEDSGSFRYDYDALGRLLEVHKDERLQQVYSYDAFGNRTVKSAGDKQTRYQYNELNQLVCQVDTEGSESVETAYRYDKRGNISEKYQNGRLTQQYYFGAMNRLEKTRNVTTGKAAVYSYCGLGHRVAKIEGEAMEPILPTAQLSEMSIRPTKRIADIIDLTKSFHNLLERKEADTVTTYVWDFNVVSALGDSDSGDYLQDELGSVIRFLGRENGQQAIYGYDVFGEALSVPPPLSAAGTAQPFAFTGYQRDQIAGTYYAQAREYQAETGRFVSEDTVQGFLDAPYTLNQYNYCFNDPLIFVDEDGAFPHLIAGAIIGAVRGVVKQAVSDVINRKKPSWSSYIGAAVGGAAGGAVAVATGNPMMAEAVEAGVSAGVTTLSKGIGEMAKGEKSAKKLLADTVVSTFAGGASEFIAGRIFEGGGKLIGKAAKKIGGPVGKVLGGGNAAKMLSPSKTIKEKVFKVAGISKWGSLRKRVLTNLASGHWSLQGISFKTWAKTTGYEVIDISWGAVFKDPESYLATTIKEKLSSEVDKLITPEEVILTMAKAVLGIGESVEVNAELYCIS